MSLLHLPSFSLCLPSFSSFDQLRLAAGTLKKQATQKNEGSLSYVKGGLSTFFEAQDALSGQYVNRLLFPLCCTLFVQTNSTHTDCTLEQAVSKFVFPCLRSSAIHQKLESDGTEKVEGSMTQRLENVLNSETHTHIHAYTDQHLHAVTKKINVNFFSNSRYSIEAIKANILIISGIHPSGIQLDTMDINAHRTILPSFCCLECDYR